jgi:hypothetical protein
MAMIIAKCCMSSTTPLQEVPFFVQSLNGCSSMYHKKPSLSHATCTTSDGCYLYGAAPRSVALAARQRISSGYTRTFRVPYPDHVLDYRRVGLLRCSSHSKSRPTQRIAINFPRLRVSRTRVGPGRNAGSGQQAAEVRNTNFPLRRRRPLGTVLVREAF